MIIDLILDRKDGDIYNAREFYFSCLQYGGSGIDISAAMDYGNDMDIRKALCKYIIDNEYNNDICKYINSQKWL